jgi:hypothetical protein
MTHTPYLLHCPRLSFLPLWNPPPRLIDSQAAAVGTRAKTGTKAGEVEEAAGNSHTLACTTVTQLLDSKAAAKKTLNARANIHVSAGPGIKLRDKAAPPQG